MQANDLLKTISNEGGIQCLSRQECPLPSGLGVEPCYEFDPDCYDDCWVPSPPSPPEARSAHLTQIEKFPLKKLLI